MRTAVLILSLCASCFGPNPDLYTIKCDAENPCPEGLMCVQNLCCSGSACGGSPLAELAFEQHATPVGQNPDRLAAGDINADGKIDLAVANSGDGIVSILLGNGDGTFQTAQPVPVPGAKTLQVTLGDLNGDKKLDLIIANAMGDLIVRLGSGDGTFGGPQNHPTGSRPYWSIAEDLDGDGRLDVAVANGFSDNVSVLLGNGSGSFKGPAKNYSVGAGPSGLTSIDANGDGKPDLATCNFTSNDVSVLVNKGDGTFAAQQLFPTNRRQNGIVSADIDRDGKMDLIATDSEDSYLMLLFGNGNGSFRSSNQYVLVGAGSTPYGIVASDFDLDGLVDVATANNASHNVSVFRGRGDETFGEPKSFAVGKVPHFLVTADFNNDGRPDLATASRMDNTVSVLLSVRQR